MGRCVPGGPLRRGTFAAVLVVLVVSAVLAGVAGATGAATAAAARPPAAGAARGPAAWTATAQAPCDALDPSLCMLPFPSDLYTTPDAHTATGRRVDFPAGAFPASANGTAFDPAAWEHNDGFSPGSTILTHVPGLSLAQSHVATISDMGASLARSSPIVLIDARTGARWPTWAELDANDPNPATQLVIIHPARNLTEGDRYLVALRNLRAADGSPIAPGPAFSAVLHPGAASGPAGGGLGAAGAAHERAVVEELQRDGVPRAGLYLAWDFTVASTRNITAPALTMRDQTFAALAHGPGHFRVTHEVVDPHGQPDLQRVVTGTFAVPNYLTATPGSPGSVLTVGANGLPVHEHGRTYEANFECEIPKAATAAHPAAIGIYGHGLFNSATEVTQSSVPQYSNAHDTVFCGTDWLGLSASTLALATAVTGNLNAFPTLADNLLQALLDAQVLGNVLESPRGFATSPAFEDGAHRPLIRSSGLVYYGNSEGGIMGGAFIALSTEVHRAVLGVPGMDYAVLLPRSADFAPFAALLDKAYPDKAAQQLGFDVIQMLWDRGEADGYAEQMTGGLPATPHHQVLLEEAFGDHQVANVTTETEARTIGAHLHEPALAPGRSPEAQPFWGIPALRANWHGPALFVWDTGVPAAPLADVAPTAGHDPHDTTPRSFPAFWSQMHAFFGTGRVTDPCGAQPCRGPAPPG